MLNLFRHIERVARSIFQKAAQAPEAEIERRNDPFSHPAIARMSLHELADLPFERR